ncbi:MAG: septum formation initiator family protein [Kiritimatiellia bacterium]
MGMLFSRIFQFTYFAIFVGIVVFGFSVSFPKYRQMNRLMAEKTRHLQRIEDKKLEIAAVREKQRRFNTDPEFVESLARANRLLYPGELVFVFDH